MFTFSGFNRLRSGVTILPAVGLLKTRSHGTLFAQMQRYLTVMLAKSGMRPSFPLHHANGSSSPDLHVFTYNVSSALAGCCTPSVTVCFALPRRLHSDVFYGEHAHSISVEIVQNHH